MAARVSYVPKTKFLVQTTSDGTKRLLANAEVFAKRADTRDATDEDVAALTGKPLVKTPTKIPDK